MNRFFYQNKQRKDEIVQLWGEDAHHLRHVLRRSVGDTAELCDDEGRCRLAEITEYGKDTVSLRLKEILPTAEARLKVHLAFGLLKGEKTEFVLQKATELGVSGFLPFTSTRTVIRSDHNYGFRQVRWEKIIRSAAAQAKRSLIPAIGIPLDWQELLGLIPSFHQCVLFWEESSKNVLPEVISLLPREGRLLLITGPEGGFGAEEAAQILRCGAASCTLGPRILRAETAAMTAVALALYQAGETE